MKPLPPAWGGPRDPTHRQPRGHSHQGKTIAGPSLHPRFCESSWCLPGGVQATSGDRGFGGLMGAGWGHSEPPGEAGAPV